MLQPHSFKPPVSERAISEPPRLEEASVLRRMFGFLVGLCWAGAGQVVLGRYWRAAGWAGLQLGCMTLAGWHWALALVVGVVHLAAAFEVFVLRPGRLPNTALAFAGVIVALMVQMGGALAVRELAVEAHLVASDGMAPTLLPGDHVFARKLAYGPSVGDVAVYDRNGLEFIHRIVAGPGDVVSYEAGRLHVNGAPLPMHRVEEPCAPQTGEEELEACEMWSEELAGREHAVMRERDVDLGETYECPPNTVVEPGGCRIPEGHWFLLGDFRTNSADSRVEGAIPAEDIEGKVSHVWLSLAADGQVRRERLGIRVR